MTAKKKSRPRREYVARTSGKEVPLRNHAEQALHTAAFVTKSLAARFQPTLGHVAGLCADLLGTRTAQALESIRKLKLASGVTAEAFDPDTGESMNGFYNGALAGFLAWSLHQAQKA